MKKVLITAGGILVCLLMVMLLVPTDATQVEQANAPSLPTDNTITLRFGHNTPENSALHQAALMFSELMNIKTHGQLVIDVYPAQQLGNDHQMVEMARKGELDIVLTPTAKMSVPVPSMQYADLPFLFPTRNDVYEMLDGEPGQMLFKDLQKIGLYGLAFWENGFKHFTGNTPFLKPEDFEGKNIRVMKSRIIMDQFESFGATPIPIDFHATRQALADGVVDGQENPLIAIYSMGFHEVQSDLVLSEHAYLGYVLSVSEKTMQRLPFDIQQALIDTAREVTPWEREETQKKEQELLAKIRASGVNVHQLSPEQRLAFAHKTQHIVAEFEDVVGPALISKTEELLFEKYGPADISDGHLIIGLNADLTKNSGAGLAIKRGVTLALDEINAEGGVLGKKLHLIARDHQVIASRGLENMKYFINRPDVIAVVGGKHSAVIEGELALVNQTQMPYLIPWAAAQNITENDAENNSVFRVSANDRMASDFIAEYALGHHEKLAIIVENTIWGRGNLEKMTKYMATQGVLPVAELVFNRGQDSYVNKLTEIINAGVDAVILVSDSHEGHVIVSELFGLKPDISVVSHWGILGGDFFDKNEALLAELDLRFFQTFLFNQENSPQAEKLLQRYLSKYELKSSNEIATHHAVAQAYDLVKMLALAIETAGSTERKAIVQALENLPPYRGAVKMYNPAFSPANHDALNEDSFFMARVNGDREIVPVQ